MIREKRTTKAPPSYIIPKICYPRIRKKSKKKATEKAEYQLIPFPLKYVYENKNFLLYGDFALQEQNGRIVGVTGALNQFLNWRGVDIIREEKATILSLEVEKKFQMQLPPWQKMVERLLESDIPELSGWGNRIQDYSLKHENVYRALSGDVFTLNGLSEKELEGVSEERIKKMKRYFEIYPCCMFISEYNKRCSKMTNVWTNEKYLWELGYTLESFSTTLLQEGIPEMMPSDTACFMKVVFDNYFNAGDTPEIISEITMRNGYKRKVRSKMYYFPAYSNKIMTCYGVHIILGRVDPTVSDRPAEELPLNKNFLKKIIKKEKETNKFLGRYYNMSLNLPYSTMDKTCKIRHLEPVVKQEEDEYFDISEKTSCE